MGLSGSEVEYQIYLQEIECRRIAIQNAYGNSTSLLQSLMGCAYQYSGQPPININKNKKLILLTKPV